MNILFVALAALRAAGPIVFAIICFCITFYDYKYFVIPNELVLAGIAIRFLWMQKIRESFLLACLFTGALILASIIIWLITKKKIGNGDYKLIFMLSLYATAWQNIMALFIALITAIIILLMLRIKRIALAPFLCFGWGIILVTQNI